jgi:hypothetical protein
VFFCFATFKIPSFGGWILLFSDFLKHFFCEDGYGGVFFHVISWLCAWKNNTAMQQCHARFYYCRGKGNHQEVPESYPEHPFDRGFHFSSWYYDAEGYFRS